MVGKSIGQVSCRSFNLEKALASLMRNGQLSMPRSTDSRKSLIVERYMRSVRLLIVLKKLEILWGVPSFRHLNLVLRLSHLSPPLISLHVKLIINEILLLRHVRHQHAPLYRRALQGWHLSEIASLVVVLKLRDTRLWRSHTCLVAFAAATHDRVSATESRQPSLTTPCGIGIYPVRTLQRRFIKVHLSILKLGMQVDWLSLPRCPLAHSIIR
jgi:hypothetical protein